MASKKFVPQLLAALFIGLLSFPALAQNFRGQVRGVVQDKSGSVLQGAKVTLLNVSTGVMAMKPTDSAGIYVFDFVEPGTYTVTVESPGFSKYVQTNVVVQAGGNVSVDATLSPGALEQSITVTETPPAIETTSSNVDLTIDTKMANDTPRIDRNPFKLTLIEPAAVNTRGEMLPYQSWAANSVDLGGDTNLKNNLLVDGNPIGIGHKAGYPPNQDDVQESVVSQNSVDAASGHSAGGAISLTTKSGTNDWHGMAFYLGRYPWLSAQADRTRDVTNAQRQHMFGGTLGNPILKNKLFNFFSIEDWKINSPGSYTATVPTQLERQGDFSQTLNADGTQRTIYNPFVAPTVDPSTGALVRTPFAGNVIPASAFDPLTAKLASLFPDPNNAGQGPFHLNNFFKSLTQTTNYYNFSDRVDYNINDKWRVSGYFGRYHSTDSQTNPLNNVLYQPAGSLRGANQFLGDVIWTVTPNTVVNVHGDWFNLIDAYVSKGLGKNGWSQVWGDNTWYAPYLDASANVPVYYPKLNIGGSSFGGPGFFWDQRPSAEAISAQVAQTKGSHYLTYGFEQRHGGGPVFVSNTNNFNFDQSLTARETSNANLTQTGDTFATFLLGALQGDSQMVGGPAPDPRTNFYGLYIGDTWKITRNLTINAGIRYEYESAWRDANHFLSRNLDLTKTDPAIAANPPTMPSQVTSIVGSNQSFAGVWNFTNSSHPGMWNSPHGDFQPRLGFAYRFNERTAMHVGYALYKEPTEYNFTPAPVSGFEDVNFLEPPFFGMTGYQNVADALNGVPQSTFNNPFPAGNPLVPIAGKSSGGNVGRGGSPLLWYPQDFQKAYNNRLDISAQRELPQQFVVSLTYFVNFGNQLYNKALNNTDPKILQSYTPDYLNTSVNNPFYQYGSQQLLPGPLYNLQQVKLGSLLTKYPLYGPLYEIGVLGAGERYQDVELRVQKRWSKGYNFLFGYIFIHEKSQINTFNDQTLYSNTLQWQDSNQPHHRLTSAGTWELPFGQKKMFFGTVPRAVDTIIGGWQATGLLTYTSGDYPRFGNLIVNSNPCSGIPSGYYFNPAAFSPLPANTYVLRSNPLQYNCIIGPSFINLDATLQKNIHFTERVQAQLKLNAYNATNKLNLGDPDTNVNDTGLFGRAIYQGAPAGEFGGQTATYGNQAGRQLELGFRLLF